jgi:penicillin amidase
MKHKLLLVLCCITISFLQNVEAQQSKTAILKGVKEPVKVIRDKWGVNHIYAKN